MEEPSFQEKEGSVDVSNVQRLSETRLKFKPVLVKKLLADESDDDSDDNDDHASNSDNSDEETDNIDGFQPLPEECTSDLVSQTLVTKTDVKLNIAPKEEKVSGIPVTVKSSETVSCKVVENVESNKSSDLLIRNSESKSILNPLIIKDSARTSDYASKKTSEVVSNIEWSSTHFPSKGSSESETSHQSQWQQQMVLDKRKSLSIQESSELNIKSEVSPVSKRRSYTLVANHKTDVKEKTGQQLKSFADSKDVQRFSSSNVNKSHITNEANDDKTSLPSKISIENIPKSSAQSILNTTHGVVDTPMKHPQSSTRPNPCHSHRSILQTPQSKLNHEISKNPLQTPATIFSHWSQQHMAQTPMQNQIPASRESGQTPATTCTTQSQNVRAERPRYYSLEGKNVRRPLAETMFSGPVQGSQLPKLQEVPNESQPSSSTAKDNSNTIVQESIAEKKSVHNSSHKLYELKENKHPNTHDSNRIESHNNSTLPAPEGRFSFHSQADNKSKLDYQGNVQSSNSNIQSSRNMENYKSRESQSVHPPVTKQPEQIPQIQCTIPQQPNLWSGKQNKIITVKDRQYLVLGVIGQGMSCEVVRAQDLSTSELRAIKCVNLTKMDKDSVQGCLQEICMLDKLKAPCVVHMYSFEVKQPWIHVVMEIGDTDLSRLLKSMLAEKKKIPLTMTLYYWTEMLTAVKHIHDNGVIHSDLKPANFLLVRGRLKLIDFGIASSINSDMTSVLKNTSIGTMNYVSPEALMDVNAGSDSPNHNVKYKISYKSDVWSLGCILYSLVYGVTPFNHIRQQWGKISAITDPKHKINFPLMNGTDPVPLILIDVMKKCLQRDPKARPTVANLLEISYLQGNIHPPIVPNIPSNILVKVKQALSDDEWKQFSEILTKRFRQN